MQADSEVCAPQRSVLFLCTCVCICTYMDMCCGGQRSLLDISLDCSSPCFLTQCLSLNLELTNLARPANSKTLPTSHTPTPPASSDSLVLGLQVCAALPGFRLYDVYACVVCVCLPICVRSCVYVGTCTITQVWSSEDSLGCWPSSSSLFQTCSLLFTATYEGLASLQASREPPHLHLLSPHKSAGVAGVLPALHGFELRSGISTTLSHLFSLCT